MSLDAAFYGFASLAAAKAAWKEQLARVLEIVRAQGVIVDDIMASAPASETVFATDAASVSDLWDTFEALETGALTTSAWQSTDGVWWDLAPSGSDDFAGQAACCAVSYVSACRERAEAITAAIDACATVDDVIAIDLSDGWPDRTCADVTLPTFGGAAADEWLTWFWFVAGVPPAETTIFRFVPTVYVTCADYWSPSRGKCAVAPSGGDVVFDIQQDGSSVGSMTFTDGETSADLVMTTAPTAFNAYTQFSIVSPANLHGMEDLYFTFRGLVGTAPTG